MRLHLRQAVCILAPLAFSLSLLFGDTGSSMKLSPASHSIPLIFFLTRAHPGYILTTPFEVFSSPDRKRKLYTNNRRPVKAPNNL